MRPLIGLLLFAALAAGDVARLHELADTRQLFLLREARQQPGWNKSETLFYRGMVEKDEIAALTAKDEKTGGAGEIIVRRTDVIPTLRLFVSGRPADLSNVSLLTTAPEGEARYRDGVLGIDALRPGFTLDFRAMQLRLG